MRRPVTVIAPKGCIFNPNFPRASFSRFNQANLLADCVMRSLADVMPERVSAGTSAHIHFVSYNGFNKDKGEYWVYLEVDEGSYGGRYTFVCDRMYKTEKGINFCSRKKYCRFIKYKQSFAPDSGIMKFHNSSYNSKHCFLNRSES